MKKDQKQGNDYSHPVYGIVGACVGFFIALMGLLSFNRYDFVGFPLILSGLLLFKPFRGFVRKLSKAPVSTSGLNVAFVLVFAFGVMLLNNAKREFDQDTNATAAQVEKQEFIENKDQILADAKALMAQDKYSHAVLKLGKYDKYNDPAFKAAYDRAVKGMYAAKTKEYVAELRTIPASEYKKNQDLYQALVEMNPDNAKFQRKLDFYTGKIEEKQKKYDALVDKIGKYPDQYGRRSYAQIAIERSAHDPDSIDVQYCADGTGTEAGWKFKCTYRGKNAFGALVRNTSTFLVKNHRVYVVQ